MWYKSNNKCQSQKIQLITKSGVNCNAMGKQRRKLKITTITKAMPINYKQSPDRGGSEYLYMVEWNERFITTLGGFASSSRICDYNHSIKYVNTIMKDTSKSDLVSCNIA